VPHHEGIASFLVGSLGEHPWEAVRAEYSPPLRLSLVVFRTVERLGNHVSAGVLGTACCWQGIVVPKMLAKRQLRVLDL
jgi:hypothetical protein